MAMIKTVLAIILLLVSNGFSQDIIDLNSAYLYLPDGSVQRTDTLTLACTAGEQATLAVNGDAYTAQANCGQVVYEFWLYQTTMISNNTNVFTAQTCSLQNTPDPFAYQAPVSASSPAPVKRRKRQASSPSTVSTSIGTNPCSDAGIMLGTAIQTTAAQASGGALGWLIGELDGNSANDQGGNAGNEQQACDTQLSNRITTLTNAFNTYVSSSQAQWQATAAQISTMSNTIQYLGATTVSLSNTLNETEQVVANLTQKVEDITSLVQQMAGTELSMSQSLNLLQNATQNNYNQIQLTQDQLNEFINITAANFQAVDQARIATAAQLQQDLANAVQAIHQDEASISNALQLLQQSVLHSNLISAINLVQQVGQIQSSINNLYSQVSLLMTFRNTDHALLERVYTVEQQLIQTLYDISLPILYYQKALAYAEAYGYVPFLTSLGAPLTNLTSYTPIGFRNVSIINWSGCAVDQSTFLNDYVGLDSTIQLSVRVPQSSPVPSQRCEAITGTQSNVLKQCTSRPDCTYVTCFGSQFSCITSFANVSLYNQPYSSVVTSLDTRAQINGSALFHTSTCSWGQGLNVVLPSGLVHLGCFQPVGGVSYFTVPSAATCRQTCLSEDFRYASMTNATLCSCGENYPVSNIISPQMCNAPCAGNDFCGGLDGSTSIYRLPFDNFEFQPYCIYQNRDDCLTDTRCGWISVSNATGYCDSQTDTIWQSMCPNGVSSSTLVGCEVGPFEVQNVTLASANLNYATLQLLGFTDAQLQAYSLEFQQLSAGLFPCPPGTWTVDSLHCCLQQPTVTGLCNPSAIVPNPVLPWMDWQRRSNINNCPIVNFTLVYACNGTSACADGINSAACSSTCSVFVDSVGASYLGYSGYDLVTLQTSTTTMNVVQLFPSSVNDTVYAVFQCPWYSDCSQGFSPYADDWFSLTPSLYTLFGRGYYAFFGANSTSSSSAGTVGAGLDTWDPTTDPNQWLSQQIQLDLFVFTQNMITFYGTDPIVWGASIGSPVTMAEAPPSFIKNKPTSKCTYTSFGAYSPYYIPVYQVSSHVTNASPCNGTITVNGTVLVPDQCVYSDPSVSSLPASLSYLVYAVMDGIVYSPPPQLLAPDQVEAARRGTLTYTHTYGASQMDVPSFMVLNPNFDPQYMYVSLKDYASTASSSNPWCGGTPLVTAQFGANYGLCALSQLYNLEWDTVDASFGLEYQKGLRVILKATPKQASMTLTYTVPFEQVGLVVNREACPQDIQLNCGSTGCDLQAFNYLAYGIQSTLSVSGNGACSQSQTLSVAGEGFSNKPLYLCAGNYTVTVSLSNGTSCFEENGYFDPLSASLFLNGSSALNTTIIGQQVDTLQTAFIALANAYAGDQSTTVENLYQNVLTPLTLLGAFVSTGVVTVSSTNLSVDLVNATLQSIAQIQVINDTLSSFNFSGLETSASANYNQSVLLNQQVTSFYNNTLGIFGQDSIAQSNNINKLQALLTNLQLSTNAYNQTTLNFTNTDFLVPNNYSLIGEGVGPVTTTSTSTSSSIDSSTFGMDVAVLTISSLALFGCLVYLIYLFLNNPSKRRQGYKRV